MHNDADWLTRHDRADSYAMLRSRYKPVQARQFQPRKQLIDAVDVHKTEELRLEDARRDRSTCTHSKARV